MPKLKDVEQAIFDHYQWFHREHPGIHPQEAGKLGQLWEAFDFLVKREHPAYGN